MIKKSDFNVAVILSGCGYLDGSEISEVILTLFSLERKGINYQCFAPNIEQCEVIDHLTGKQICEKRNVLLESARIVRGKVKSITECNALYFNALIVPGGFGVTKNLSDFASLGINFKLKIDILKICRSFIGKAVGYICIAPILLPLIYGKNIKLTIGNNQKINDIVNSLGGVAINCTVDDIIVDIKNKVISTPGYMLANNISEAYRGIDKLVGKILELSDYK
ncbi:Enhancing lycopene biosynthesis protein 2 [Candidatus Arsenophonus lipoptenae]|uniref:Glyoxalase n=1 Tax=Candidatus Arsenophonus lipoptenae TaxID=634113 RepID=A0A0X8CXW5_9GAMM|nr:isoprenoid biosynthesis glyoxalase ElbB [Candidatus Arsenophonus lipoptenae]AMA64902.1 Enhancing lycopene biosynthesis protein 2 [Candidatus Arsenophonus lipoptenae]